MRRWSWLSLVLLAACDPSTLALQVDLRTDLLPGLEFASVEVQLLEPADTQTMPADGSADYTASVRVASFDDLRPGNHELQLRLLDDEGAEVLGRRMLLTVEESRVVTFVLTRSCRDVTCPAEGGAGDLTECVGGACASPSCVETGEGCPTPECTTDADCGSVASCAEARCDELGVCIVGAIPGACAVAEICEPDFGCLPLPGETFVPTSNACQSANEGPLAQVAQRTTGAVTYGVWTAGRYVLAANTTGGLASYYFDGADIVGRGTVTNPGWAEAIWSDGDLIVASAPGTGFYTFTLDWTGRWRGIDRDTVLAVEARRAWGDGSTLYVPNGSDGVRAYSYAGGELTPLGMPIPTASFAQGAYTDGNIVLLADGNELRVLEFDGTNFTELDSVTVNGSSRVWGLDGLFHVSENDRVAAYRFEGGALSLVAEAPLAAEGRDVWSDGAHVFVAANEAGLYAFDFDGTAYTELDFVPSEHQSLGVVGDGTYIYLGDGNGGLRVFSGFECTAMR